jgi:Family of unknown function (DUF5832)
MAPITTKERDFLEQDQPIRGQNYVCLSFISPEDAIASKDAFAVSKFLKAFTNEARTVIGDIESRLDNEDDRRVIQNMRDRFKYIFDDQATMNEFDMYKQTYTDEITKEYAAVSDNLCNIRGIKIRGAYESIQEAQARANALKRIDPNFSVYVCEMGCWCPWSPSPDDIADSEYSETQLNTLMQKYNENMALKDELYEARKREAMRSEGVSGVLEGDASPEPADAATPTELFNEMASQ